MKVWCDAHCKGQWEAVTFGFTFTDKYDAVQFKLMFSQDLADE